MSFSASFSPADPFRDPTFGERVWGTISWASHIEANGWFDPLVASASAVSIALMVVWLGGVLWAWATVAGWTGLFPTFAGTSKPVSVVPGDAQTYALSLFTYAGSLVLGGSIGTIVFTGPVGVFIDSFMAPHLADALLSAAYYFGTFGGFFSLF